MKLKIKLQKAAFSYGHREIFRGLNLDLTEGDIFCLLGPNGCGKTTLLRCLNGILPLQDGHLWINDQEITTLKGAERAKIMGFVFQEHQVLFPYSVLDTVVMGRAPYLGTFSSPSKSDLKIAEKMLETVGLMHLRDKRYPEISGGERQLVNLARALTQEPAVLFLDEPTSHLDFRNQILILKTINQLAREKGIAIVMATHFPDHAFLMANQVILMKNGGFLDIGAPEKIITEDSLKLLYGLDVKIVSLPNGRGKPDMAVIPLLKESDLERSCQRS